MNKVTVKIFTSREQYLKRPNVKGKIQFPCGLITIEPWIKRCSMNFNKPICVKENILDSSKVLMLDFHYNFVKNKCGSKTEMFLVESDGLR